MATEELHNGDTVWQKTGGPEMTIVELNIKMAKPDPTVVGSVKCEWISEDETQVLQKRFAISDLTKTKPS